MVGCGIRSSSAMVKKDGKEDGSRAGLISKGTGLSYAEVLRSGSVPVVSGRKSRMRAPLEEPCDLDLFPILRRDIPEDYRTAVDCSLLESIAVDPPDLGKSLCPLGKQSSPGCSARGKVASTKGFNLNSNLYTGKNMRNRFYLALGRVVGIFLGRGSRSILGLKHKGLLPMKRSFRIGLGRNVLVFAWPAFCRNLVFPVRRVTSRCQRQRCFYFVLLLGVWRLPRQMPLR